jgi:hypothetical protein
VGRLTAIENITTAGDYNEQDVKDALYYAEGDPDAAVVALGDPAFLALSPEGRRDRALQARHGRAKGKR